MSTAQSQGWCPSEGQHQSGLLPDPQQTKATGAVAVLRLAAGDENGDMGESHWGGVQ